MTMTDASATPRPGDSDLSAVEAVRGRIDDLLRSGGYPAGARLPPERELAERFGVNRLTVNKALGRFVDAGRLTRRVGSGTYVTDVRDELKVVDVLLPHNPRSDDGPSAILGRPGIAEGVHDYFRSRPVRMAIGFFRDEAELAERILRTADEAGSAQIIWYRPGDRTLEALRALRTRRRAFCLVDCPEPREDCDLVGTDDFQGGLIAAGVLTDGGRRRLAYLGAPIDQENLRERREGFSRGAARVGTLHSERTIDTTAAVPAALDVVLAGGCDGIGCSHDWIALAVLAELRRRDVAVPDRVAVVGYDDVEAGRYASPALTTVAQDFAAIGFRAADVVDRAWRGPGGPARTQLVGPRLVKRASA